MIEGKICLNHSIANFVCRNKVNFPLNFSFHMLGFKLDDAVFSILTEQSLEPNIHIFVGIYE